MPDDKLSPGEKAALLRLLIALKRFWAVPALDAAETSLAEAAIDAAVEFGMIGDAE